MSGYIEVFILVAIALGGSGMVLGAAGALVGSASAPSVGVASAAIRQGPYTAVESVTVSDLGTGPLGAFTITTSQAPAAASYCYSVEDPAGGAVLSTTCPGYAVDPGTVVVTVAVKPGGSEVVELVITGGAFLLGSAHQISVTTSSGAQAAADVQVVPA